MAMSDCPECYETPCTCGAMYKNWSQKKLSNQIAMLQRVKLELARENVFAKLTTNNKVEVNVQSS